MPQSSVFDIDTQKVPQVAPEPDLKKEKVNRVLDTEHNLTGKKKKQKIEYSSGVEKFFAENFAPELSTLSGRFVIITIWVLLGLASIYGCMHMKFDLSLEYFIPAESSVEKFFDLDL